MSPSSEAERAGRAERRRQLHAAEIGLAVELARAVRRRLETGLTERLVTRLARDFEPSDVVVVLA